MHHQHSIFPCNEMQNSPQYDILVNHANIVQYNGHWFLCTVLGTVVSAYIVHSTQCSYKCTAQSGQCTCAHWAAPFQLLEYQCVKFMTEVTSMGCTVVSGYIVHSTQSGQCTCAQWAQWAAQWAGCRSVKWCRQSNRGEENRGRYPASPQQNFGTKCKIQIKVEIQIQIQINLEIQAMQWS